MKQAHVLYITCILFHYLLNYLFFFFFFYTVQVLRELRVCMKRKHATVKTHEFRYRGDVILRTHVGCRSSLTGKRRFLVLPAGPWRGATGSFSMLACHSSSRKPKRSCSVRDTAISCKLTQKFVDPHSRSFSSSLCIYIFCSKRCKMLKERFRTWKKKVS